MIQQKTPAFIAPDFYWIADVLGVTPEVLVADFQIVSCGCRSAVLRNRATAEEMEVHKTGREGMELVDVSSLTGRRLDWAVADRITGALQAVRSNSLESVGSYSPTTNLEHTMRLINNYSLQFGLISNDLVALRPEEICKAFLIAATNGQIMVPKEEF